MQGVLSFIGLMQALGGIAGLAAIVWAYFHHTSWPPVYMFASAGFYLVVLSGAWRLMSAESYGRPLAAVAQLAQLVRWSVSGHMLQFLAGPQLAFTWSLGVVRATVGAGAFVRVAPPPAGALSAQPQLAWSTVVLDADSSLFASAAFNVLPVLALAALAVDVWLEKRRLREAREEAAELGASHAPRSPMRTPTR
jgi:hypothetical protein